VKRLLPFILIAVVAFLTVGIATAVYRTKMRSTPAPAAGASVTSTPAEVKEDSSLHVRGPRNAPVTIEVYGDFQCPSCALATAALDELEKQYPGKLRIVFHEFPLAMHKHALEAAIAAEAAGLQGHFWEMHDMLYQYQPVWSEASNVGFVFSAYASSLGLDPVRFQEDVKSPEVRERVLADGAEGTARGVQNTPTIFINGREAKAAFTLGKLQEAVEEALAAKKSS
jgi:protein-disulfide isomerase